MHRAAVCAVYGVILLAGSIDGFSGCSSCWQVISSTRLSASKKGKDGSSSDGAGSWRTKAKEFNANPEFDGDDSDKKLNIAFVVSYPLLSHGIFHGNLLYPLSSFI